MKTIRERLRAGLEAKGWKFDHSTGRYWVMTRPDKTFKLFLGENGALRKGRSGTQSISLTDSKFYKELFGPAVPQDILAGIKLKDDAA